MFKRYYRFLQVDRHQRIIYGLFLFLWVLIADKSKDAWFTDNELGIPYFYIFLLPTLSLLTQIIFNNNVGWLLTLLLWTAFILFSIVVFVKNVYERLAWTDKGNLSFLEYLLVTLIYIIIIFIAWTFYKMRPRQTKKHSA